MRKNRVLVFTALLLMSLFLSACGSAFAASSWPGITYDEEVGAVYLAYNQQVYALQIENGVEAWHFPEEASSNVTFFAPPVLTGDGQLLISGYDNVLYSLDPAEGGKQNWAFDQAYNRFVAPALSGTAGIYAPNSDHNLYALSPDGDLIWNFTADEPLWAAAVSDGQTVFLPSLDHSLYALDAQNGNLLWREELGGSIVGRPTLSDDGELFVGTFGREVVAIDTSSGNVLWRSSTEDWVWSGPSLADGVLYVADLQGNLFALDAQNGEELWQVSADGAVTGSPLVANEQVYISTENGEVLATDLGGTIQWRQSVEGQAYSSPVAAGDLILIGLVESESGTILVALDTNGEPVWSFAPES